MKVVEYWHGTIKNYRYVGDISGSRLDLVVLELAAAGIVFCRLP